MRGLTLLLCALLLWGAGCESTAKVDNPVVGPPPPRLPPEKVLARQRALGITDAESGVARVADASGSPASAMTHQVSSTQVRTVAGSATEFPDDLVVAKVNEQPLFAAEFCRVLDIVGAKGPMLRNLELAMENTPDADKRAMIERRYNMERQALIQKMLPKMVERKLLVQAYKNKLKKAQLDQLETFMKGDWESYLEQKRRQFQQGSIPELLALWETLGFDLELMEQGSRDRLIAGMYVQQEQGKSIPDPSRQDLMQYYNDHHDDFKIEGKVRWQQLVVLNSKHKGTAGAQQQVEKIVELLLAGADFSETIQKHGDGIKAKEGGVWDWTVRGSLMDKNIEEQIFELPVGEMSGVIETKDGFQIVLVLERVDEAFRPFEMLQEEITEKIKEDRFVATTQRAIAQLRRTATIWTIFDGTDLPEHPDATPAVASPEDVFQDSGAGVTPASAAESANPFED